jgi:hypothetical protein
MKTLWQLWCRLRWGHLPEIKKVKVHGAERWCRVCKKCSKVLEILW